MSSTAAVTTADNRFYQKMENFEVFLLSIFYDKSDSKNIDKN